MCFLRNRGWHDEALPDEEDSSTFTEQDGTASAEGLLPADFAGTWLDEEGDGYTFTVDETGTYTEGVESWELTYSILNGDQVSIWYDDGDHATFNVEIDGDRMIFDDEWIMTRQ